MNRVSKVRVVARDEIIQIIGGVGRTQTFFQLPKIRLPSQANQFHSSVLLLISGSANYFGNVMTKFIVSNSTDT